jgi:phosphatidylinositol kinase/protein kinase (PI-3  family)
MQAKVAIDVAEKVRTMSGEDAAKLFEERVLSYYAPLFHEWFIERFPEPTQWLASRNAYSRTAAVMSMVGYILGCEGK